MLDELLPRLVVKPPDPASALDWPSVFDRPMSGYWLEIGFGAGEHLAWQAKIHPEIGFLGCEPFVNGITTLLADIDSDGVDNVRIFPDDARLILAALPSASVGRCFILFPDPWPKRRHRERRLIAPSLLDELARVLTDGAELRLASDHPDMVDWMLFQCRRHPDFAWTAKCAENWYRRPPDWPQTRYEEKAMHGKPVFLTFVRHYRKVIVLP